MSRKLWIAVIILGVVMIPVGVVWMIYSITQTGQYDSNAVVQTSLPGGGSTTSTGAYVSESAWPIVAFFVAFIGGTLITVGSLGFVFSWFTGGDDEDHDRSSPSEILAHAVPTTTMGWGGDAPQSRPGAG